MPFMSEDRVCLICIPECNSSLKSVSFSNSLKISDKIDSNCPCLSSVTPFSVIPKIIGSVNSAASVMEGVCCSFPIWMVLKWFLLAEEFKAPIAALVFALVIV